MAICGFVFYISIQLILIGIWHQKYRLENPRKLVRPPELHNDSRTHLKTSMETEYNNPDASFGVTNPPYNPNPRYDPPYNTSSYGSTAMNQQTLLQQPGAAHSFNPYDKVVWPTQVEFQPDSNTKFSRPMEYSYGDPSLVYTTGDPEQPADFKYAPDQTKRRVMNSNLMKYFIEFSFEFQWTRKKTVMNCRNQSRQCQLSQILTMFFLIQQ